jgi:hypothetical protein
MLAFCYQAKSTEFAGPRSAAFAHEEARRGRDAAAGLQAGPSLSKPLSHELRGGIIREPPKTRKPDSRGNPGNLRSLRL